MSRIAYYRVSTEGQSIEAQRQELGGSFDREFTDEGVSGATKAADRPGFATCVRVTRCSLLRWIAWAAMPWTCKRWFGGCWTWVLPWT